MVLFSMEIFVDLASSTESKVGDVRVVSNVSAGERNSWLGIGGYSPLVDDGGFVA